jgi:hypothetical protein
MTKREQKKKFCHAKNYRFRPFQWMCTTQMSHMALHCWTSLSRTIGTQEHRCKGDLCQKEQLHNLQYRNSTGVNDTQRLQHMATTLTNSETTQVPSYNIPPTYTDITMREGEPYLVINNHGTLVVHRRQLAPTWDNTDPHSYIDSLQYLATMVLQWLVI